MLVKFSCGCIGFPSKDPTKTRVIKACDRDSYDNEFSIGFNNMVNSKGESKDYEYLNEQEVNEILDELGGLIADGYKLREIKGLLS